MTRLDRAAPLAVESIEDGSGYITDIAVFGEVWGGLGNITGRAHIAIPTHPVPSHLPFMAAPSAMPLSSSTYTIGMPLVQGTPLGYPEGPPLTAGRSAFAPPLSPLRGRRSDQPYVNLSGP